MDYYAPLEHGHYYHIFNRGVNCTNLFHEKTNYEHFLRLYAEHIEPVAETYAWVLMRNHFHVLVRIFHEDEIGFIKPKEGKEHIAYFEKKKYNPSQQFGNLFNAYTKAFNPRYKRTGNLFERRFKRVLVDNEKYFKNLVYYIHRNPVNHRFCEKMIEYPWSSYLSIISLKDTKLKRDKVIGWFNSQSEFVEFHSNEQNIDDIERFIIE